MVERFEEESGLWSKIRTFSNTDTNKPVRTGTFSSPTLFRSRLDFAVVRPGPQASPCKNKQRKSAWSKGFFWLWTSKEDQTERHTNFQQGVYNAKQWALTKKHTAYSWGFFCESLKLHNLNACKYPHASVVAANDKHAKHDMVWKNPKLCSHRSLLSKWTFLYWDFFFVFYLT